MKFYIASRMAQVTEVRRIISVLEEKGHTVTLDWTRMNIPVIERPYSKNPALTASIAQKEIDAVSEADVFILLTDKAGTGMYVEFGAALAKNLKIFTVGEYKESTVFHLHPNVTRKDTFEEVLDDLQL